MIKQIISTLLIFLITLNVSAQNSTEEDEHTFGLTINNINIEAVQTKNLIKTKNILNENKSEFQVEYHFDDGQLFFIKLVKPDLNINKKYEVKRIKNNGYGYRSIVADYKIDFLFPREKQEKDNERLKQFTKKLDFANDEQIIYYFEELYRNIQNHLAENIGTVAFFGDAVAKNKIEFLYYKFDNEDFSSTQKVKIQDNSFNNYTKKHENSYRIAFDRNQLKNHKTIFFSSSINNVQDTILLKQTSINLVELRKQTIASQTETTINNDLFIDQNFEDLIVAENKISQEENRYIGNYTTKSSDKITLELRANKIYYKKVEDLEYIGLWKLGEHSNKKTISIYNIYTINRKVGTKSKPADVGSSFDILIDGERLLYPLNSPAYTELEKINEVK